MNFKDYVSLRKTRLQEAEEILNEVKFSEKNLNKVAKLYGKIMGKHMGGVFKPFGIETFKRKTGPGNGIRMMNNTGAQLRFNWDAKRAKKSQYDLTSIDYWDKDNIDLTKPTRTVMFSADLNVVQVLGKITDALLTGTIREAQEIIDSANDFLFEKLTTKEKSKWMEDHGLSKYNTAPDSMRRSVAKKKPELSEELEVFLGQKESNSFNDGLKKADKMLDTTVYADPDTVFDELEDLTQMVAGGFTKSLVVTGMGGIGKTYHVTEGNRSLLKTLGEAGGKWELITAPKASITSFYKDVYQMRDKIIVWDECDALFEDKDIMTALKGALDTSGQNYMSYGMNTISMAGYSDQQVDEFCNDLDMELASGEKIIGPGKNDLKLPSKYRFTGSMIFISNMKLEKFRKVDTGGALMSRSLFIDIYLEATDVVKRIKTIGYAMSESANYSRDDIDEIVDALSEAEKDNKPLVKNGIQYATAGTSRAMKGLSVRSMVQALNMKIGMKLPNWKELAQKYA